MKIGIKIKIDVTKLDKTRFFRATSGAIYADLTMFLDTDNPGKYGDHGPIRQSLTKEERDSNLQVPIVGNGTVFYGLDASKPYKGGQKPEDRQPPDEDIPF